MSFHRFSVLSLIATMFVAVPVTRSAAQNAPSQYSTVFGGSGGDAFTRDCGPGRLLAGLRGRAALLVDAIGIICRPVNADGTLGPPTAVGTLAGGGGGTVLESICPSRAPVMVGIGVKQGAFIDLVEPLCSEWNAMLRTHMSGQRISSRAIGSGESRVSFRCGLYTQPGSGIRGRAKLLVDAIGMICDEP